MKTLTYALLFAAIDIVPTCILWAASPTDSVRVWYPTLISYIGEHLVTSASTLVLVCLAFRAVNLRMPVLDYGARSTGLITSFGTLLLALLYLGVDLAASVELALIQSAGGGIVRLWHTQRLTDYLCVREPVYAVFELMLLTGRILSLRMRRSAVA